MFSVSASGSALSRTLPRLGGVCIAAVLMYAFFSAAVRDPVAPLPKPAERRVFPDLKLVELNGREWALSAQRGAVVLLNVFSVGCGPCRLEVPKLREIEARYRRAGLIVIGVSVDENPSQVVPEFVDHFRISYPVLACRPLEPRQTAGDAQPGLCGHLQQFLETRAEAQVGSSSEVIPATVLIDHEGRLARVYYGYYGSYSDRLLDRDVRQLLRERE